MHRFLIGRLLAAFVLPWIFTMATAHAVAPAAPSNLVVYVTNPVGANADVAISYDDNSSNETGFQVWQSTNGGAYALIFTSAANATTLSGTLPINATYKFKVRALNAVPEVSGFTNEVTVVTTPLGAPLNLSATVINQFQVLLRWDEASTTEAGFAVEQKTGTEGWQYLGSANANQLVVGPTSLLSPSGSFQFRVRAWNGATAPSTPDSPVSANVTAYSNIASATTAAFPLTAVPVTAQATINLTWTAVPTAAGYHIFYRSTTGPNTGSFTYLDETTTALTYQVTAPKLAPGISYQFYVKPHNTASYYGQGPTASSTTDGLTSSNFASITKTVPFSHSLSAFGNGTTVTTYAASNLPPGLTLSGSTISGTPTAKGLYVCPVTANFASGMQVTENLALRVLAPEGPPVAGTTIAAWNAQAGQTRDTNLAGTFVDEDTDSAVRISTSVGDMNWILYDTLTPETVSNLMTYVNANEYNGTFVHRHASGFVVQGGGYKPTGNPNNYTSITRHASPVNEPGISPLYGTLSMAKSGGLENSASSEYFINLADNRSTLDDQNGGFTVFGRVAGNGMSTVVNPIASLPKRAYPAVVDGVSNSGLLSDCPINDVTAPTTMDQSKLVTILSTTPIQNLSYSIESNSNPAVATAQISSGHLLLNAVAGGVTTIVIKATDLDGNTATQSVQAFVSDTFTTWAGRQSFASGQDTATSNPDNDLLNNLQEYAFFGSPTVANPAEVPAGGVSTAPSSALTLTFPVRKFTQGLTYTVQATDNVNGTWITVWTSTAGLIDAQVTTMEDLADRTRITVKDVVPLSSATRRFMRVKTEQQ